MDQPTHSWIAIRAVALLEDTGTEPNLVALLKPHVREASIGAWIPDQADARRGGSRVENHVLKMSPYRGGQPERFVTKKTDLLKHIGPHRLIAGLLDGDRSLDSQWWAAPYKGDVTTRPGQHIPNRAMALSTMLKDLLLLGNKRIDALVSGNVSFVGSLTPEARTQEDAAAVYFFMLSHFVADACMPCHCDSRKLAGYNNGLHMQLEKHWAMQVGTYFEKDHLLKSKPLPRVHDVLGKARNVDGKFSLAFSQTKIPNLIKDHDVWLELIYLCRASFALAGMIASSQSCPYGDDRARAKFKDLQKSRPKFLAEMDQAVMHDAVLNTAIIWKHVWTGVCR